MCVFHKVNDHFELRFHDEVRSLLEGLKFNPLNENERDALEAPFFEEIKKVV